MRNVDMKKIVLLLSVMVVCSCTKKLDVAILDDKPFIFVARDLKAGTSQRFEILPGSLEYERFSGWVNSNKEGWEKKKLKWLAPYTAFNSNFRILFSESKAYVTYKIAGKEGALYKEIDSSLVEVFSTLKTHNKHSQKDVADAPPLL